MRVDVAEVLVCLQLSCSFRERARRVRRASVEKSQQVLMRKAAMEQQREKELETLKSHLDEPRVAHECAA